MLEPGKWLEPKRAVWDHPTLKCLVSPEFLADDEVARRIRFFKRSLRRLSSAAGFTYSLQAAGEFGRWPCQGWQPIVPIGKRELALNAHNV